jgi:hypothetical protein
MAEIFITPQMRAVWHDLMALDPDLSNVAVRVGIAIGTHFDNNTAETFVGQNTIAKKIGMKPRSVWGAIQELKTRGHLTVRHGGRRSNYYGMPIEKVAAECELKQAKGRSGVRTLPQVRSQKSARKVAAGCELTHLPSEDINSRGEHSRKYPRPKAPWRSPKERRYAEAWDSVLTDMGIGDDTAATDEAVSVFIIEDSDDARAWSEHLRSQGKIGTLLIVIHDGRRGAWMPSRRPPSSSGEAKRSGDEAKGRRA